MESDGQRVRRINGVDTRLSLFVYSLVDDEYDQSRLERGDNKVVAVGAFTQYSGGSR